MQLEWRSTKWRGAKCALLGCGRPTLNFVLRFRPWTTQVSILGRVGIALLLILFLLDHGHGLLSQPRLCLMTESRTDEVNWVESRRVQDVPFITWRTNFRRGHRSSVTSLSGGNVYSNPFFDHLFYIVQANITRYFKKICASSTDGIGMQKVLNINHVYIEAIHWIPKTPFIEINI